MHTKGDERLVYVIGAIGALAILVLNLKSGFSTDSLLAILKDLSPLAVSILIFKGLFHKPDFKKAANRAIEKIRQTHEDIFSDKNFKGETGTEECLFLAKRQTSFIPLGKLREGTLEIRVTFGTLDNFEIISSNDSNKERRIADKKKLVRGTTLKTLQLLGAKFHEKEEDKDCAVRIKFERQASYDMILAEVIDAVISSLKSKSEENAETTNR